jgi:hypothetical protein
MKIETDSRHWSSWIPFFIIPIAVFLTSFWYLFPAPAEFPMDDTYIHFVYAQNLIDHGELMFSSPGESGVGSTSMLWVYLIAAGYSLGLSLHMTTKILGIISLIMVGIQVYYLIRPKLAPVYSLLCALAVVLSGNVLWFGLSGMETVLFLALGLLALLVFRSRKWGWLGVVLGLLVLTRPEGIILAGVIILVEVVHKRIHAGVILAVIILLILTLPWYGYLFLRTGHILPTSAIGKQLSSTIGAQYVVEKNIDAGWIAQVPALVYLLAWISYLIEFALGGVSLPAPNIPVFTSVGGITYSVSIWALLGISSAVLPLLWIGMRYISNLRSWKNWMKDKALQPVLILVLWCVLHNIAYIVFLPIPGTASRYGALNHVLLWIALTIGLFRLTHLKWVRVYRALWLVLIVVANLVYWNDVYDANLEHLSRVRILAADYLRNHIPEDGFCAVSDIGVLRYYGQRPILDLGGLVNPDLPQIYLRGELDEYIANQGITCVILPGRSGTLEDGWFDLAEIMGLTDTSLFRMHQIAVFEIDRDIWLQGYLSTNNYQASIVIYQLEYLAAR